MVLDIHEENLLLVTKILIECFLLFFCYLVCLVYYGIFFFLSVFQFVLVTVVSSTEMQSCTCVDKLVTSFSSSRFGELLSHVKIDIYRNYSVTSVMVAYKTTLKVIQSFAQKFWDYWLIKEAKRDLDVF